MSSYPQELQLDIARFPAFSGGDTEYYVTWLNHSIDDPTLTSIQCMVSGMDSPYAGNLHSHHHALLVMRWYIAQILHGYRKTKWS